MKKILLHACSLGIVDDFVPEHFLHLVRLLHQEALLGHVRVLNHPPPLIHIIVDELVPMLIFAVVFLALKRAWSLRRLAFQIIKVLPDSIFLLLLNHGCIHWHRACVCEAQGLPLLFGPFRRFHDWAVGRRRLVAKQKLAKLGWWFLFRFVGAASIFCEILDDEYHRGSQKKGCTLGNVIQQSLSNLILKYPKVFPFLQFKNDDDSL